MLEHIVEFTAWPILTGILIGYVAELSKYYDSELWKQDFAADEAGNLPSDLKRGVLSEDGIWNLLSDYREIKKKMQCT